ncbi:MAG TPA: TetR/AcrR family transcriptional regulator [Solirubrobacteraceae bacterium]|nr:TetR/AcrR family transcriptional regulator [Solirubrobacteraceae bacterium]
MSNKNSVSSRRRLAPDERRRQLIEVARSLLQQRPGGSISTADVAEAAGVTRALVHRYFHGIDELRLAVAADMAGRAGSVLTVGPGTPVRERVRHNVAAFLDGIEASREVWLSTMQSERARTTDHPAEILRRAMLERMLDNNADLVEDTPWTRLCLQAYIGSSDAICREWVLGRATREQAEAILIDSLLHMLTEVIPGGGPALQS